MISLCMIVKNEEQHLEQCLNSVKNCVDEIIIVDTGSTDRTIEIAKKFDAKIFEYKWNNDFSAARNFGLEKATNELILYLDADEKLTSDSQKELNDLKKRILTKAYNCKIININNHTNRPSVMNYPRIFPNLNSIRFEGKIHEQIIFSLNKNHIEIQQSDIEIIHSGYDLSEDDLKKKALRNLDILREDFAVNQSSYNAFQIAQTYNILENEEEAEKYFLISLRDRNLPSDYKSTALRVLSHYSLKKLDIQKAFEHISEAIKQKPNSVINILQQAQLFAAAKLNKNCFEAIDSAVNLSKNNHDNSHTHLQEILISQTEVLEEGIKYALQFGEREKYEEYISLYKQLNQNGFIKILSELEKDKIIVEQLSFDNITERQIEIIVLLLNKRQDFQETIYDKLEQIHPNNYTIWKNYGLILFKQQKYNQAEEKFRQAEKLNPHDFSLVFFIISIMIIQGKKYEAKMKLNVLERRYSFNQAIQNQIKAIYKRLEEN